MTDIIKAWHFVGNTLRDGRPVPKDGVWLRHEGRIEICASGLHASRRPWDALQYAPGTTLCYVECRGDVQEEIDKLVCRERRIIMRADVTETLLYFARMQALSVIHLWARELPDVVLDYLMTGDESLRIAASAAARGAASAAESAAESAAASAAESAAASAVASAAASAAVWSVASAAESAAASAVARGAESAAVWSAASAVASAAAWSVASAAESAAASAVARGAESAAVWSAASAVASAAASADFGALIFEQFGVAT